MERRAVYRIADDPNVIAALDRSATVMLDGRTIEVIFPAKPSDEVRAALKAAGFRWGNGRWAYVEEEQALPGDPPPAVLAEMPMDKGMEVILRRQAAAAERAEAKARALLGKLPGPAVLLIGGTAEYWA